MEFWTQLTRIYSSYAKYIWDTITHPFEPENYFTYLIGVSLVVWIFELISPWRKEQKRFRKDFWIDAFYMFFNFYFFNLLIFIALSTVSERYFGLLMDGIGLTAKGIIDLSNLSLWLQFPIFFIVADFIQWCIHVFLHKNKWFWRFHKVHHSVTEMGFAAHLRYHWMETIVYKTGMYLILSWLLNFKLEHAFFMHAATILIGHLNHANVSWDYGVLKYILNNPKMHIWHHAKDLPKEHPHGMNFGISLSIWDYLFHTNYIPYDGRDIALGFDGIEEYPDEFLALQIEPFKTKK